VIIIMNKKFKLDASEIKHIIPNMGHCYASDMITVDGNKVGYMYIEQPDRDNDSGWRFFAGNESREYSDNPDNFSIYDVNTIANYDRDIVPFLDSEYGVAFGRDPDSGKFVQEEFEPLSE
jgi:hypothetical protein